MRTRNVNKLLVLIVIGLSAIIIYQNYPTLIKYLPSNVLPSNVLPSTSKPSTSNPSVFTPSVINLTSDAITVILYPNVPQQFSYRSYTGVGGVGGVPREIKTYYLTITFDPNIVSFSSTPPEMRLYYFKVSEVIDQYYTEVTPLGGFYTHPNPFGDYLGQYKVVQMFVRSVSKDSVTISIKGSGI
jgi:hypothetical protein